MFPDSDIAKNFSYDHTKTSQIITQAIGLCAEEQIINNMRNSLFTLLIDESTDVSVTRQKVIMARIFTTQVETHLYKVVALSGKATRENLFNVVNSSFEEDNIPWQNCISILSDGAKLMVREFNSVLSCIRSKHENVWFLHCTCHVAHLAASHAYSELPDFVNNCREMYAHISKLTGKRQDEF
ncbi:hypothetical protein PR048_004990 [Dryococelus australis]|uniref:DUF4371 domain-containing protein n=1 Tax=Dryococelus australis TaxID=614101 RepID=A0ABQ9I6Y4_9NEOP|nr:hypothetical protein PR048_004990 [Dryococelus australis]